MFITHSFDFENVESSYFSDYGEEVFTTTTETVDGCLYSPVSTEDNDFPDFNRDRIVMRIDLPKSFTKSLSNSKVKFENTNSFLDGKSFKVIGDSGSYMVSNTPGNWNRYITCEEILEGDEQ